MQLKLKFFMGIALLFCFVSQGYAQTLHLTGKVTQKADGQALPGASVTVKGTTMGVVTDVNGNYALNIPQGGGTIVVSFVGMVSVERTVTQAGTENFTLEDNPNNALNEVVVIGYGTQKVTKVSGAISTIKSTDIQRQNPVRAEEAIQGRAAGVTVIQGGTPGSSPTVAIRGIPSYAGSAPLVVIDGVQQSLADLNSVNPIDIESISVLKDASATAIYGVKGGNGIIVVTTKTGRKNMKPELTVNSSYGVQEIARYIGVLNATEYGAIVNEGSVASGGNVIFPDLTTLGVGTNWQKEVFKTAPLQQHTIGVRGGSETVNYFLSGGYTSQGGIVGGIDKSRFDRGNFTANIDFQMTKKLKLTLNTTGVILNSKGIQENSFNSVIGSALNFDPTVSVLNTDPNSVGKYGYSNLILSEVYNPLTKLDNTYNKSLGSKLYGKFEAQYDILKNLKLTSRFGYTKYDANSKGFTPLVFYGPLNVDNSMNADGSTVIDKHNSVNHDKVSNFNYTWETFANYNFKVAEDHTFETVVGFSLAKESGNAAGVNRQDVPFNSWEFADYSAATGTNTATNPSATGGYYYQYFKRNMSFFGRLNYDYKEKYLASFTARRDGSTAFGADNKFANFFSGSVGWVASKESFFNVPAINFLKIRGSYGTVGNDNTPTQATTIITGGPDYGPTANSNGYNFSNVFYPGSTLGTTENKLLGWESQKQANVGFDLTMFNGKLTVTADYYEKRVGGLLFQPATVYTGGTTPVPAANIGSTKNNGVDISIGYNETIGNGFKLGNTFNITTVKSVVTATNTDGTAKIFGGSYFNGQSQQVTVFEKGQAPGYFYGYKTNGLFQNAAEIAAAPTQTGAQPGDIRFVDVNGDGVINAADRTNIGNPFPNVILGWTLSMSYKNFDFNAFTYASIGNDIYRAYERNANYTNKFRGVLARWTGEGTTNDARNPRYSFTDANSNIRASDRYVEDGSFVKIKNIQLGYTFPRIMQSKVFKSIRIYAQVRNAATFTKYSGYDPEISGGVLDTGVDRGAYPQPRTYSMGLDIKL
ncbi:MULTISPECIES: TonB-dependent receptor [unclassified Mucilaginibacter]|uniref:SusC/RagA family TonB-linked outer membrane protein n=1 Tax=unclassified Mucilaginibacter TaxID=2617802 RepID=UPI002AC8A93A|nr:MULTISPECIES: TonB-dependent receptor [unclassified Mucilaginibacter]MEB0261984.1 TonB-dependent receptor [Mucilaginibacter sp. 10I4]MEB0279752.1 TonB-dependent receptor [Mucilaginibacter sp. 10B2]MEB0301625.1 TonB-dependent receptor [Mucilaginibacter sp. 5C4]WPX23689.1 TonB-dependent receptor [Mucilaginibacter sp. 5C4]